MAAPLEALVFALLAAGCQESPTAHPFTDEGARPAMVADHLKFTEGPCILRDGRLIFSDTDGNRICSWRPARPDALEVYREPSHKSNGNTLDPQGRLITCEHGRRDVVRQEKDGKVVVLASQFEGKRLNSPNDVCVSSKGLIYFTDPPYGIDPRQSELGFNGVYLIKGGTLILLARDFDRPNGIVLSPDEKTLYVADTSRRHIRAFPVKADGTLGEGRVWAGTPDPDGLRIDRAGNVWSASGNGVNVISPKGEILQVIKFPQQPANLCFSPDTLTLYVTARTAVYSIRLKSQAR